MKKCVACEEKYPDSVMRCSKCGLFLIADVVSDLESESMNSRRRIRAKAGEQHNADVDTTSNNISPTPNLKPGKRVESQVNNTTGNTMNNNSQGYRGIIRRNSPIRLWMRLRPFVPAFLIIVAIIMIVINWNVIKPVLTCILVGAIIGGAVLSYFSIRFGHHFNPDVMSTGAIVGAILAVIFRYNILGIGTEISVIIYALGPVVIILFGIWYAIRSMMR